MNIYSVIFILLLAVVGVLLFQTKHKVIALEKEYQCLQKKIIDSQEATHILKAEWAYLTEPKRLQTLATKFLKGYKSLKPQQVFLFDEVFGDERRPVPRRKAHESIAVNKSEHQR